MKEQSIYQLALSMEELRLPMDGGGVYALELIMSKEVDMPSQESTAPMEEEKRGYTAPATNSPKRRCCLYSSLAGFVKHLRRMATLAVDVLALLDVGVLEAETKQTPVSNL